MMHICCAFACPQHDVKLHSHHVSFRQRSMNVAGLALPQSQRRRFRSQCRGLCSLRRCMRLGCSCEILDEFQLSFKTTRCDLEDLEEFFKVTPRHLARGAKLREKRRRPLEEAHSSLNWTRFGPSLDQFIADPDY